MRHAEILTSLSRSKAPRKRDSLLTAAQRRGFRIPLSRRRAHEQNQNQRWTEIYYKDWGTGDPIVFSHGWPLTADDWDAQMLFFGQRGYRVIAQTGGGMGAPPRHGTAMTWTPIGRSGGAIRSAGPQERRHGGHSTGGGEVARYLGSHGTGRVAKAALVGAVTPLML